MYLGMKCTLGMKYSWRDEIVIYRGWNVSWRDEILWQRDEILWHRDENGTANIEVALMICCSSRWFFQLVQVYSILLIYSLTDIYVQPVHVEGNTLSRNLC